MDYGAIWNRELDRNGLQLVHSELKGRNPAPPDALVECVGWSALKLARCGIPSYLPERGRVLEIGCGPGFNLLALSAACGTDVRLYGVDPSERMIELSTRVCRVCERITTSCCDIEEVAARHGGEFDLIFECIVFQHLRLAEVARIFRAARKLLHPEGRFVFQMLRADSPRVRRWNGPEEDRPVPCMRGYTEAEVRAMLQIAGFDFWGFTARTVDGDWFLCVQEGDS